MREQHADERLQGARGVVREFKQERSNSLQSREDVVLDHVAVRWWIPRRRPDCSGDDMRPQARDEGLWHRDVEVERSAAHRQLSGVDPPVPPCLPPVSRRQPMDGGEVLDIRWQTIANVCEKQLGESDSRR